MTPSKMGAALSVALLAGTLSTTSASAQATNVGTFKNLAYQQTGPNTVVFNSAFFNADAYFTNIGDYSSATLTYPGAGSPAALPATSPTSFGVSPSFASQADMDAAYPTGDYTIALAAGTQPAASFTVSYTADAYTSDIPALSAASFTSLQGLSTGAAPLTLTFNSFTPAPAATAAYTFFTIFGANQGCGFLSPSATSCTINPNALAKNTTYSWELDFSDRIESNQNGALTYTDFDVRTDGSFTTAAPELSTWALLLLGFAGLGLAGRASRRAAASGAGRSH